MVAIIHACELAYFGISIYQDDYILLKILLEHKIVE
jgi:hypothetical protein